MMKSAFTLRPINNNDKEWISRSLIEYWGSNRFVTRGRLFHADENPGFVALIDEKPAGLLTYEILDNEWEITTLNNFSDQKGIGTALIDAVTEHAMKSGCRRLFLITTNDSTHALRFYQRYGFTIATIYPNSLEAARKLKPEIPLVGEDGIPIRDEIEMEIALKA